MGMKALGGCIEDISAQRLKQYLAVFTALARSSVSVGLDRKVVK